MTLRGSNTGPNDPEPCEEVPECPICGGRLETVYDRYYQKVCVCIDCHAGLTIPQTAWSVARLKRARHSA